MKSPESHALGVASAKYQASGFVGVGLCVTILESERLSERGTLNGEVKGMSSGHMKNTQEKCYLQLFPQTRQK